MSKEYKIVNIAPLTKIPLDCNQVFSYKIDQSISTYSGQIALIPFSGRKIQGVILNDQYLKSKPAQINSKKLKEIIKIEGKDLDITTRQLELAFWMTEQNISPLGLCLKQMAVKKVKISQNNVLKIKAIKKFSKAPVLNDEQKKAAKKIDSAIENIGKKRNKSERIFLLHGITGSGKTEVYMHAIRRVMALGKQTIMLVPEITLTPQAINRFTQRFGSNCVAVLHSRLSSGEKYQYWQNIRKNQAKIIIGPRSAIFAPAENLGLIILDEEHDQSYKQYDQNPRYHSRDVALKLSEIAKIPVILGSATPSIESYYYACKKQYTLLVLRNRFKYGLNLPPVKIIDMREEFKKRNFSLFSEDLVKELNKTFNNNKQALIFVNRRGVSTFVMCRDCGYVIECPNCSVSLTYHTGYNRHIMICHHCGYQENVKAACPKCDSKYIKYFGTGTQRVEQELIKILPRSKILRMDSDTMNKKGDHYKAFQDFSQKRYDILIGTQMITKGIDLSNIELVGIIATDALFNFPDFRTNERAFQAITQVSGRTSRSQNTGSVILQTYNPENFVIKYAANHDYEKFYQSEINLRKELRYPPFKKLIKIIIEGSDYNKLGQVSSKIAENIRKNIKNIEMIGPSPAFIVKKRNKYIWNIIVKYQDKQTTKDLIKFIPQDCKIDINPEDLL